ncbi:3',5'-nucleoside bisphosphate phosphatase [Limnobacter alexandrii]|uniref:3',5'-nucleoside bisphosphate phosphatase n=1 Tax=Limnobacter alexandrii TaxID=2570352 RepID=UPI001485DE7D|nr:3',5'-nucleoside bisphosphate phosphatase [Limnobacter alexandrii]
MSTAAPLLANKLDWNDPHLINADLHCHSTVSDGTLAPEELAARAAANGVQIWSLTDHDEVGGLARAAKAAAEHNMIFIPGVEISVTWSAVTLHIVGLNVDYENSPLEKGLASVRHGRTERAMEMSRQLEKVGIEGVYEGALKYVGNPNLISRTHFARCLVERKVCTDIREVFERFLTPGKPGYVPHEWASLKQAVDWILDSNGLPVIAHPGRYDLNPMQMDELVEQFVKMGGVGIEVVTGSHTTDQYATYARKSVRSGLKASRGSDFHGPTESRVNLGELPRLPDGCVPIWDNWGKLFS